MTVEIICGDISALPSSDHAAELLPLTDGDTLTLSCTDSDLKLYPRKWTRDFDPWPRSADTHLTHRVRSAAPVL